MTRRRHWQRGEDGRIVRVTEPYLPDVVVNSEDSPSPPPPKPPSLRQASVTLALRLGLRDTYDHLGTVVVISLLWSAIFGLGVLGGQAVGGVLFGRLPGTLGDLLVALCGITGVALFSGPFTAGCYRYARQAAARQEPEWWDFLWGFRQAFRASVLLCAMQWGVAFLLSTNIYFYAARQQPVWSILSATFGYVLVFWLFTCCYQWALLIEQELPPGRVVQKSALLVLDNFPFTLVFVGILGLLTVALWLTVIGGLVLWAGTVTLFCTQATRELLRKYGLLPPDPTLDPITDETHE